MFRRFVHTTSTTLVADFRIERLKHLGSSIIAKTRQDPNVSLGLGQSLKRASTTCCYTITCISYTLIQCTGKHQSWLVGYLSKMHNNAMLDLCQSVQLIRDRKASQIGGIDVGRAASPRFLRASRINGLADAKTSGSNIWQRKEVPQSSNKAHCLKKKWKQTCCL